jgi:hypothetical protein
LEVKIAEHYWYQVRRNGNMKYTSGKS